MSRISLIFTFAFTVFSFALGIFLALFHGDGGQSLCEIFGDFFGARLASAIDRPVSS
jgi:ABC-type dipeptide/oligopeptide/nickel transport system permease subunit